MEPVLDFVAEIALWGSVALMVWGGILTVRQRSAPERKRELPAAPGGRASLAN